MAEAKGKALGMIEVCGYSTALLVINHICHYMDVRIVAININKPAVAILEKIPLQAQVKFQGSVEQVQAAIEAGHEVALKYNEPEDIITGLIANPHEGLTAMIEAWE